MTIARAGLPNMAAAGATCSRIQRTTVSAIGQRSVAAGTSATRCPSLSTTASRRTTSSAPHEAGPVIEGSRRTKARSGVSRRWQAEGGGGAGVGASAAGTGGSGAGASARGAGSGDSCVGPFGAFSERVRELALRWGGWARAPGLATRADGPAGAALGGCAERETHAAPSRRESYERESSVRQAIAARLLPQSARRLGVITRVCGDVGSSGSIFSNQNSTSPLRMVPSSIPSLTLPIPCDRSEIFITPPRRLIHVPTEAGTGNCGRAVTARKAVVRSWRARDHPAFARSFFRGELTRAVC